MLININNYGQLNILENLKLSSPNPLMNFQQIMHPLSRDAELDIIQMKQNEN